MPNLKIRKLATLLIALVAFSSQSRSESIKWSDIGNTVEIIGRLGVPLLTVVTIEATVVDVSAIPGPTRHFLDSTSRFLRIETVDGLSLKVPPLMRFSVQSYLESYTVPPNPDADRKRSERLQKTSPDHAAIGTLLTLYAYEVGRTPPNPKVSPKIDAFPFISGLADPDPKPGTNFRTFLYVAVPRESSTLEIQSP